METSDALDLQRVIFKSDDPKKIARSLERPTERRPRQHSRPVRSGR
jgi:hypothetical protein